MLQDIRVAWRFLRKAWISTALAIVTLGLTVAMCSLAVGVVDDTFWRPLAFANGGRLVTVYDTRPSAPQFQVLSYPDYTGVRDRLRPTTDKTRGGGPDVGNGLELASFVRTVQTLSGGEWPTRVQGELVSGNYFEVLGARPFMGRLLAPDDDRIPSGHPIVVLGHGLWTRSFGSDPAVVGKSIRLNRYEYTVAGVAAPGFHGPAYPSELWIPLMMAPQIFEGVDVLSRADIPILQTVGRPSPGAGMAQLRARVQGVETSSRRDGWRLTVLPAVYLKVWPAYRATVARFLGIFAALTACVVVIACANLAGLLLARNGERRRELAVREALGATRRQLLRRIVSESLIVTALGGAVGVWIAYFGAALVARVAVPVPAQVGLTPDLRLVGISIAVSLVASLFFTAAVAFGRIGGDIRGMLSAATTAAPRTGLQRTLVIAQVAMSCMCLTAAGLLVRTALAVDRIDAGFDTANTLTGMIGLGDQGYTATTGAAFYQRLQEELEHDPQVEAVALEWNAALGAVRSNGRFSVGGREAVAARYNVVGPGYFGALRIPIVAGREFDRRDTQAGERVAVINETLAARIGGRAIGDSLIVGKEQTPRRIVGIVRDVKYNAVTEPAQPFVYLPLLQEFRRDVWVHVRSQGTATEALVRDRVRRLDSSVAVSQIHTLTDQLDQARATPRRAARMAATTAAVAVFLALVGVYGLLTASVDQRKRELSIRAALGATPRDIIMSVAVEGVRLTAAGLIVGAAASFVGSSLLAGVLYGVAPRDPLVFALVPGAILLVSIVAWLAPARRAAGADPVAILKSE